MKTYPLGMISIRLIAVSVVIIAVILAGGGFFVKARQQEKLAERTEQLAVLPVKVTKPEKQENMEQIRLPGRLEAFKTASIYARVDGYVANWLVDIGDKVEKGDVLAELDTPDIDQELSRAEANLNVAEADAALAKTTAQRWQELVKSNAVSVQEADQKTSEYNALAATVESSRASLNYLKVQQQYANIKAPFSGVVTARNIDVGDLITAGNSGGEWLYEISQTDKIRVYVRVPQSYLDQVSVGSRATISVPGTSQEVKSAVTAYSGMVEKESGTALMQILVDNDDSKLAPGSFASVALDTTQPDGTYTLPSNTLIFDADGLAVATVSDDNKIVRMPVQLARDLGTMIEIKSGLSGNERVITSPPDGIQAGTEVRIQKDKKKDDKKNDKKNA